MEHKDNPNYYIDANRYKTKYICFDCKKSFKRKVLNDIINDKELDEIEHKCPDCGKLTTWIGPKFRAPKQNETSTWHSIKVLQELGLLHFSGWATNRVEIPNTTKKLKSVLENLKENFEYAINKWTTTEYNEDNKTQIKYFSERIKKIDEYLNVK
jgi:DNA-directed RNA polymerase subunit RPC12/RpoP